MEDNELLVEDVKEDSIKEEKKWCVYVHTSPSGKKYVGITSLKPNQRWKNGMGYMKRNEDGSYAQQAMAYAIIKYPDWNLWQHEIVIEDATEEDAKQLEIELIQFYKTRDADFGYNMTDGGEGTPGKSVSDETKQKISNALKGKMVGEKNPNYGNHKMAGNNNPNYGNTGIRNLLSVIVYCIEFKEIFYGAREAERLYGIDHSCLIKVCNGKRKSAGKHPETGEPLHWLYVEEAIEQGYITQEELDDYLNGLREKEKETK